VDCRFADGEVCGGHLEISAFCEESQNETSCSKKK
jgi:hypothetical protein